MKEVQSPLIALVDENDVIVGHDEKLKVHKEALLHRAFSIFIFNDKNEMLIHQRAHHKYHSPSLWTNACCSHLFEKMTMEECIHDRLQHEMGFDTDLNFKFKFTYRENFDNGLTEYETDHVYVGKWNAACNPNPDEVVSHKWISLVDLNKDIMLQPQNYTYWFKHIMQHFGNQFK